MTQLPANRLIPLLSLLCVWALPGCNGSPPASIPSPGPLPELASRFDPAACGTLRGQVLWDGPLPEIPPYRGALTPRSLSALGPKRTWPNPHTPRIGSGGEVASAVVFLQGIDPRRSRPWDHLPVQIAFHDYQLDILQGESKSLYGFVRRGEVIEMVSRQPKFFHSLQARGAAFFTAPFPDPDRPQQRRLERSGVVDLASDCGCFWMAGHLFVDDHPYYARTDAQGRFTLSQVPAGRYRLVCWLPNWHPKVRELDADTWAIASVQYQPPLTISQDVQIGPGETWQAEFAFSAARCAVSER